MADELRQGFPLGVMVECLGAAGRRAVADDGEDGLDVTGRGRGLTGPVLAEDPVLAGTERLLAVVDRLCAVSPVVVAEDLQWADEASLTVWRRLGRAVRQLPLLVVGSLRQVPAREEVARLARGVAASGRARRRVEAHLASHPGQLSPGRPELLASSVERCRGRPARPSPLALHRARSARQGTRAIAPPRHAHSARVAASMPANSPATPSHPRDHRPQRQP